MTSKVRDVDLLKFSTVHVWLYVSQETQVRIFFHSFFQCFVAKQYILKQVSEG